MAYQFLTMNSNQPCRGLLSLPGEIRNRIYFYVLHDDWPYIPYRFHQHGQPQPGVTCVSRQLRTESLSIYYAVNSFSLCLERPEGRHAFIDWTMRAGEQIYRHLRSLSLCLPASAHTDSAPVCLALELNPPRSEVIIYPQWDDPATLRGSKVEELAQEMAAESRRKWLDGTDLVVFVKQLIPMVESDDWKVKESLPKRITTVPL